MIINEIKIDENTNMYWVTYLNDFTCYTIYKANSIIGEININYN